PPQGLGKGRGMVSLELPLQRRRLATEREHHGVDTVERRARHDADAAPPGSSASRSLHFSAPATTPSRIWRWKNRNTASVGRAEIVEPAISMPQSTPCSPCENKARPTGSVRRRSESTKISGYKNEFQLTRKALIATTASTGLSNGNTI